MTAPQDAADTVARSPDSGAAPATFHLRVDLPEESQHSDLPVGDPYVVRVFPVAITIESGQLSTIDGSDFRVFDTSGAACNSTEDPLGYTPLVGADLTAGVSISGILTHRMPRVSHEATVVYFVWAPPSRSGARVALLNNRFNGCRWTFNGPARDTLAFMTGMSNGIYGGQATIEKSFDQIHSGTISGSNVSAPTIAFKPTIFIGHGRSRDYLELESLLHN